ncbi:MAG: phosphotransferase [Anaerolineae bacterium]|nr:phosphotransferase [Anaerolineae bacterium]
MSALPSQVSAWITETIGPGATITAARLLPGATSSTLWEVELTRAGEALALVLRLFTNREWLAEEPDLASHEAAALRAAGGTGIPVPALVAVDDTGAACGLPAVLMTRLPGRIVLAPADRGAWLAGLARTAAQLHVFDVPDFPWLYRPYCDVFALEVPRWTAQPAVWCRVLDVVQGESPSSPPCFIHRDYHPVNVLWERDAPGGTPGVVDWPNACRGPAGEDVGRCRANLALLHGLAAADEFLRAYQAAAGAAFTYDPYWDLLSVVDMFLPGPPVVYSGWAAYGVRGLTDGLIRRRLEAYVASLVARL